MVLKLPGTVRGPRRMLLAHTDTVPICVGSQPVRKARARQLGQQDSGLGADDRSGTAVLLSTVLAILRGKLPHPPLTFLWTVQEEVGLFGVRHLKTSKLGKPRLAFNFDGGSPAKLTIGATGGYRMTIEFAASPATPATIRRRASARSPSRRWRSPILVKSGWHGQ